MTVVGAAVVTGAGGPCVVIDIAGAAGELAGAEYTGAADELAGAGGAGATDEVTGAGGAGVGVVAGVLTTGAGVATLLGLGVYDQTAHVVDGEGATLDGM